MARALRARAPAASLIAASRSAFRARRRGRCAPCAAQGSRWLPSPPRATRSAPMAWARCAPGRLRQPGRGPALRARRRWRGRACRRRATKRSPRPRHLAGPGVDAATASEPRHAWGPVEDVTARREPHRTAQVRRSSDQRTACGANHLVEGGKLCTSTKQAGCLIPDLLDLRVHERLGWLECYPASIFDTYAATAKRTTRSRMIMTFASVCEWSNTCRVDAQRLRLKPRDRLTTENVPCTRQPRTRKGWGARASDSIVPRSEMARRRARGTLSRGEHLAQVQRKSRAVA